MKSIEELVVTLSKEITRERAKGLIRAGVCKETNDMLKRAKSANKHVLAVSETRLQNAKILAKVLKDNKIALPELIKEPDLPADDAWEKETGAPDIEHFFDSLSDKE